VQLVAKYAEKDLRKAAEYAQQPSSHWTCQEIRCHHGGRLEQAVTFVRRQCNNIIGMNLFGQKKWADAIPALEKALQASATTPAITISAYAGGI